MNGNMPNPDRRVVKASHASPSIRCGALEATFQPEVGGRMISLRDDRYGDLVIPLNVPSFAFEDWPKAGAFPLFPFHNRLRNASFRLNDREVRVRPNAPDGKDALHGPAHRQPWNVTASGRTFLQMALDYRADGDWPFDFQAVQRYTLHRGELQVRLDLINSSETVMPGGIGWHPYFPVPLDGTIAIRAENQWTYLPQARHPEKHSLADRRDSPAIPRNIPNHFSGWTKAEATLSSGARITLSADSNLSCFVVLRKLEYTCLEPVSHVAGALSTLPDLWPETGLRLMDPGSRLSGRIRLAVR